MKPQLNSREIIKHFLYKNLANKLLKKTFSLWENLPTSRFGLM